MGTDFWLQEAPFGSSGLVAALLNVENHWGVAGCGDGDADDGELESRLQPRGNCVEGESEGQTRCWVVGAGARVRAGGMEESEEVNLRGLADDAAR